MYSLRQFSIEVDMQSLIDGGPNSAEQFRAEIAETSQSLNDKIELKQNYQSIQVTRGIAAIIVVWLHLGLMENTWGSHLPHIMSPFVRLGHAGVDAFFIVSGFVLVTAHWDDFGRGKVVNFLLKRLIRVYPYFIVTCIPFLLMSFLEHHHLDSKTIGALLLVPRFSTKINPVAWSLAFEIIFYAALGCVLRFRRSALLPGMVAWTLLIAVWNTCFKGVRLNDCAYVEFLLNPISLEFVAGVLLAALIKFRITIPALPTMIVASVWLIVGCAMRHPYGTDDFVSNGWRLVWFGVPCFLLVYSFITLELTSQKLRFPKLLLVLGDASYSIYLLHPLLLSWTSHWFGLQSTSISCVAASLVCAVLFPTVCIPFYYFVEKPLLNFCKRTLRL
jgi:exopolysaccharide production protein ExoZ